MSNIEEKTKKLISETLGIDQSKITSETDLHKDLGADSLDVVELTVILEKEFNTSIPDEKLEYMRKVGDFIEYFTKVKPLPLEGLGRLKAA